MKKLLRIILPKILKRRDKTELHHKKKDKKKLEVQKNETNYINSKNREMTLSNEKKVHKSRVN